MILIVFLKNLSKKRIVALFTIAFYFLAHTNIVATPTFYGDITKDLKDGDFIQPLRKRFPGIADFEKRLCAVITGHKMDTVSILDAQIFPGILIGPNTVLTAVGPLVKGGSTIVTQEFAKAPVLNIPMKNGNDSCLVQSFELILGTFQDEGIYFVNAQKATPLCQLQEASPQQASSANPWPQGRPKTLKERREEARHLFDYLQEESCVSGQGINFTYKGPGLAVLTLSENFAPPGQDPGWLNSCFDPLPTQMPDLELPKKKSASPIKAFVALCTDTVMYYNASNSNVAFDRRLDTAQRDTVKKFAMQIAIPQLVNSYEGPRTNNKTLLDNALLVSLMNIDVLNSKNLHLRLAKGKFSEPDPSFFGALGSSTPGAPLLAVLENNEVVLVGVGNQCTGLEAIRAEMSEAQKGQTHALRELQELKVWPANTVFSILTPGNVRSIKEIQEGTSTLPSKDLPIGEGKLPKNFINLEFAKNEQKYDWKVDKETFLRMTIAYAVSKQQNAGNAPDSAGPGAAAAAAAAAAHNQNPEAPQRLKNPSCKDLNAHIIRMSERTQAALEVAQKRLNGLGAEKEEKSEEKKHTGNVAPPEELAVFAQNLPKNKKPTPVDVYPENPMMSMPPLPEVSLRSPRVPKELYKKPGETTDQQIQRLENSIDQITLFRLALDACSEVNWFGQQYAKFSENPENLLLNNWLCIALMRHAPNRVLQAFRLENAEDAGAAKQQNQRQNTATNPMINPTVAKVMNALTAQMAGLVSMSTHSGDEPDPAHLDHAAAVLNNLANEASETPTPSKKKKKKKKKKHNTAPSYSNGSVAGPDPQSNRNDAASAGTSAPEETSAAASAAAASASAASAAAAPATPPLPEGTSKIEKSTSAPQADHAPDAPNAPENTQTANTQEAPLETPVTQAVKETAPDDTSDNEIDAKGDSPQESTSWADLLDDDSDTEGTPEVEDKPEAEGELEAENKPETDDNRDTTPNSPVKDASAVEMPSPKPIAASAQSWWEKELAGTAPEDDWTKVGNNGKPERSTNQPKATSKAPTVKASVEPKGQQTATPPTPAPTKKPETSTPVVTPPKPAAGNTSAARKPGKLPRPNAWFPNGKLQAKTNDLEAAPPLSTDTTVAAPKMNASKKRVTWAPLPPSYSEKKQKPEKAQKASAKPAENQPKKPKNGKHAAAKPGGAPLNSKSKAVRVKRTNKTATAPEPSPKFRILERPKNQETQTITETKVQSTQTDFVDFNENPHAPDTLYKGSGDGYVYGISAGDADTNAPPVGFALVEPGTLIANTNLAPYAVNDDDPATEPPVATVAALKEQLESAAERQQEAFEMMQLAIKTMEAATARFEKARNETDMLEQLLRDAQKPNRLKQLLQKATQKGPKNNQGG